MLSVSRYNIYLPLDWKIDSCLLVQGVNGAFEVVSVELAKTIENAEKNPSLLDGLSQETRNILQQRGYITQMSEDKEIDCFSKSLKPLT